MWDLAAPAPPSCAGARGIAIRFLRSSATGRACRYVSRSRWRTEFSVALYTPRTGHGILSCEGISASSRRKPLRQRTPVLLQRASSLLPPRSRGRRPARKRHLPTAESARVMSPNVRETWIRG